MRPGRSRRKLGMWASLPPFNGGKRRLAGLIFGAIDRVVGRAAWPSLTFVDGFLGGGSIALYAKAQGFGRVIAIDIADDGPGLPPKAQDNLFRPFFGSARPGGSGLGLAIARELTRAHGGELTLVSTTGSGTVFRLTLPAPAAGVISRAPMSLP